jgi:UDP-glucuronate 4-epimerase
MTKKVLITGSAGFIGFHLSKRLLGNDWHVIGLDALTEYYDVELKLARLEQLKSYTNFTEIRGRLEDEDLCANIAETHDFDLIIHLAAQAGVRYSIDHPKEYVNTNLIGTFNVLELARSKKVKHLLAASTSSVYGANKQMPFDEAQKTVTPMSFYAATKMSNELMAHSYAHIFNIPTTMFRFFTVYGPWGRPDMALFKFVRAMLDDKPIDIYNHGEMKRDFTYVEDLTQAIELLAAAAPPLVTGRSDDARICGDSLSTVAPFRSVNIGNSSPVNLMDYIKAAERALGKTAKKNYLDMQVGDVPATWANTNLLRNLTGYQPSTPIDVGVDRFVEWFCEFYQNGEFKNG